MRYYAKRIGFAVCIVLLIFVIDRVLCHRTYYIPKAKIFVNFKYVNLEDETTEAIENNNMRGYTHVRINYFSKHLLPSRSAWAFSKRVDWIAMWPPAEGGFRYIINPETMEIITSNNDPTNIVSRNYLNCPIVDKHSTIMNVVYRELPHEQIFEEVTDKWFGSVKEPFIIVNNASWLLSQNITFFHSDKAKKAHLWHLFY